MNPAATLARAAPALLLLSAAPALAADSDFEFWMNPSVSFAVAGRTELELETAQRLRNSSRSRPDTYFGRLWLNHRASDTIRLGFAVERRVNDGAANETRLMQQVSGAWGILRARARLEQRFIDGADKTGLRLRTRLGVNVPLDEAGRWTGFADAEPFVTLVPTSRGGDTGMTALRTQLGVALEVSDRVELSLGWLRSQERQSGGRPDRIGHAPILGLEVGF